MFDTILVTFRVTFKKYIITITKILTFIDRHDWSTRLPRVFPMSLKVNGIGRKLNQIIMIKVNNVILIILSSSCYKFKDIPTRHTDISMEEAIKRKNPKIVTPPILPHCFIRNTRI